MLINIAVVVDARPGPRLELDVVSVDIGVLVEMNDRMMMVSAGDVMQEILSLDLIFSEKRKRGERQMKGEKLG